MVSDSKSKGNRQQNNEKKPKRIDGVTVGTKINQGLLSRIKIRTILNKEKCRMESQEQIPSRHCH